MVRVPLTDAQAALLDARRDALSDAHDKGFRWAGGEATIPAEAQNEVRQFAASRADSEDKNEATLAKKILAGLDRPEGRWGWDVWFGDR